MARKSLNTLQAGRALAAVAVLLFHANDTLELPKYLGHPVAPILRSGNSGVQFFFVLSGFVILLAHFRDLGRPAALKSFLWKRFRRIYPPLWIILGLLIPVYFLVPRFGEGGEREAGTILSAFLLTPAARDPILTLEWTLRHELIFYAFVALCIWRVRFGLIALCCWLGLSVVVGFLSVPYPWSFFFNLNHLLFGMGMLACLAYRRRSFNLLQARILAALGALLFATAWVLRSRAPLMHIKPLDLCFGLGAMLMILGLVVIEAEGHIQVPRGLVFLGEASYAIYLAHYPAISLSTKLCLQLGKSLPPYLLLSVISAIALAVGILFHVAVEKPLLGHFSPLAFSPRDEAVRPVL